MIKLQAVLSKLPKLSVKARSQVVMGLLATAVLYAGWQTILILKVEPNQVYIAEQKDLLQKSRIKFDDKTAQSLKDLLQVPVSVTTGSPGKADPFN